MLRRFSICSANPVVACRVGSDGRGLRVAMADSKTAGADDSLISVGVARIDVTPDGPIRQNGYAARKTESTGVAQRLWAKALAIGSDEQGPAILVTVDNCLVPAELTDEVARRLEKTAHIRRERFVVCASHTHAGPCLKGAAPFIFGEPTPPEHQARIDRYTEQFTDWLEKVAVDALAARRPGRLAWAQGRVGFAANRRVVKDGRWVRMAHNPAGPVDHDLPVLRVTDADGRLRAILVNYACHAVTVRSNQIHGDWPGSAQLAIESKHPGVTAMVSIGCGADANPQPFVEAEVDHHGQAVADEVERLLAGPFRPAGGLPDCRLERITLPLDKLPTRDEWKKQAAGTGRPAYYARIVLERLDRGIEPPASFPYTIQTWSFGDDLGMVFLAGEVVVDYSLRLKKELGDDLWVTAYANDVPCYVASRRVIQEGGYEVDGSMPTFDKPARLALETEDLIVGAVHDLLPGRKKTPRETPADPPGGRPNILWITCEDMSPNLGCYGDTYAVTPNLDRLAARGVRYTHVFSHAGVCAPSRSGLITGMYPTSLGSHHMRCTTTLPGFVKCFPEYLRNAGYFCTNQSKTDYNFPVPPGAWDVPGGAKAHWRNRQPGQPFFSVFNLTITHESRIRAKYEKLDHDPAQAVLPPYLPDTPLVRRDWARYHDLITQMDAQAGQLLGQLEEDGLADDTIVFFFSDHGVGLPRAKQWIYDAGTHVPLIVFFPEKYRHLAPGGTRFGRRSAGRLRRHRAVRVEPRRTGDSGPRPGRAVPGAAGGRTSPVRLRRARPDGRTLRHEPDGPRPALQVSSQLFPLPPLRSLAGLHGEACHDAGVAAAAGGRQALGRDGLLHARREACRGTLRHPDRSPRTSEPGGFAGASAGAGTNAGGSL